MAKNVEIIITAEDRASKKLVDTSRNLEKTNKQIVETGKKSKASNEAIAQFMSLFGGSELAGASGALTSVADKFGEIQGEVAGAKAQALLLKGVVAVGVFAAAAAVGRQIARWAGGASDAEKELAAAAERMRDLNQQLGAANQREMSEQLAAVTEIADAEERRAAAQERLKVVGADLETKARQVARATEEVNAHNASWSNWYAGFVVDTSKIGDGLEQNRDQLKSQLDLLREEHLELQRIANDERAVAEQKQRQLQMEEAKKQASTDYLTQLQRELELLQSQDKIKTRIEQNDQLTQEDKGKAIALSRQIEAERQAQEDRKRLQQEQEQAAKQAANEQRRLMEEQARERERLEKAFSASTSLQANESRLLTRGDGHDLAKQTADATKRSADELQKQTAELKEIKGVIGNRPAEEVRREMELIG